MSNSDHLKMYVMDNECHRAFDGAYAADPHYLPSQSIFPSSIHGFCICDTKTKAPVASFYCFPYVAKRRWRRERVLRVTRPLVLQGDDDSARAAAEVLIREVHEIGRRAAVDLIEVELYRQIESRIFFPSASCAVNTYNALDQVRVFEAHGFACSEITRCFELDLGQFRADRHDQIDVRKHGSDNEKDRELYYELWSSSGKCPYDIGNKHLWRPNVFGWPRAWYSDFAHILDRDDYVLFAQRQGKTAGFVHWWPNLYPLTLNGGRNAVFGNTRKIRESLDKIAEGKIFRIAIAKKVKQHRELIEKALITHALGVMQGEFGFQKCQIGNVPADNEEVPALVQEMGGKKVHEIWFMRSIVRGR